MRRLAVVGTRPPLPNATPERWAEHACIIAQLENWLFDLHSTGGFVLVSGGAEGVDRCAEEFFDQWVGGDKIIHRPDYLAHGSRAPLLRNWQIVDDCDELHAWPSSWSRGTWYTIRVARAKPCTVREPWKDRAR